MSRWLAEWIYKWRLPLSAFILLGAIASLPHVNLTHIDNDITAWFSREDPVFKDYERLRSEFGGTRSLIVALQADSPDRLFSRETLEFIDGISGDIERVSTVQRVVSLATATVVQATPDGGLDVRPLFDDLHRSVNPEQTIRRRALDDDLIRGDLLSEDATVTALVITFDEDRIDEVRAGVIQQIHRIVDPKLPSGVRAYYNGSLEISETYNRVTLDNQSRFTPPILLFTLIAIYFTFRSWRKTILAGFAVGVSVAWTLGLYWLMGFTYNILASMLLPLIGVLAIADDVHMMQHWDEERRHGGNEYAFKRTVAHLAAPLLGASATTALGMVSLATSKVVAVRAFGIGAGVGIMVDFAISLVLVPTLLTWVRPDTREAPHEKYLVAPMQRIARFSCAHPSRVLVVSLVLGIVAALGMLRLHVDTNHINFFSRNHPLGESARVIDKELSGVYSFQMMFEGPEDSMKSPDVLAKIDNLAGELRRLPHVKKVTSVADYVKRINKELHDGRPEASVVPRDRNTIAQELFVFTLGSEGRHELERVVASDYSRAQMSVKLESMSSDVVLTEVEAAERLGREMFAGTNITVLTTGSGRLFSTLDHYLVTSQLSSFGTAFITVFGVIFVVFRSARFGLLTIVPNVLPVLAVLGIMGYLGISMNVATIMVSSVALGVVDDDTIHFINRYRKETAAGASTDEAIAIATEHEGRASLTTAFINSCGFAVLLLSEYRPTAWFGGLLALTMAVAFLGEVFILPATIKLLPRVYGAGALRKTITAAVLLLLVATTAMAQPSRRGYVSLGGDYFPNRNDTSEGRARIFAEQKVEATPRLRITLAGFAEGLVRNRHLQQRTRDAIFRVQEGTVQFTTDHVELLAGYGTVVWGVLDELQPTDVVNPLEVSRFFFDGRSEARMPVGLARARVFLSDKASIEGLYVPVFRRGRFDQLDEPTSPFTIVSGLGRIREEEPARTLRNAQRGGRLHVTSGRVDWSVTAWRGFDPFPLYRFVVSPVPFGTPPAGVTVGRFTRFTMIGGDFETVWGKWGVRGELAAFARANVVDPFLHTSSRDSFDGGVGVDRKAGDYRITASVLVHRDASISGSPGRTDASIVFGSDRNFARERYQLRTFAVYSPTEQTSFLRAIATAKLRDNFAIEGSGGWLEGDGSDLIGRFKDSDFVYARVRYYF